MKTSVFTCLFLVSLCSYAQTAKITLKFLDKNDCMVSFVGEKIEYNPSPAIGLTDIKYQNFGVFDDSTKKQGVLELEIQQPLLVRMALIPYQANKGQASNHLLFLSPKDDLTITIQPDKTLSFSGKGAIYQSFLRDSFKNNFYDYLPAFGYKPTQVNNSQILPKIDSLQAARQTRWEKLQNTQKVSPDFEAYISAMMMTEPYLLKLVVSDKNLRKGAGVHLRGNERKEIQDITLQNFKILPDAALISDSYRSELRNFIQIPVVRRYPTDSAKRFVLSAEALEMAYQLSEQQLQNYPLQLQYLRTHWLDYATTYRSDMTAARTLLAKYETSYPSSSLLPYFKNTIANKERMKTGNFAPNFTLKDREGKWVSLESLRGKPVCIAFCFNLKQHEFNFRPLEEKYRDRLTFVYLNVTPNTPFEVWQSTTEKRPGVVHLWASEEEAQQLKDTFLTTMRFPYVVIDAQGKLADRWIPQEFPDDKPLQAELRGLVR
ncbi:MAG: peroxiredoxin family protein [Runella sp.]